MSEIQQFGSGSHRSGSGALLSSELERISGFLRFRGLLLVEGLGGWVVVVHPEIAAEVDRPLINAGCRRVVLGASLEALHQVVELTVGEIRVFESLSPGPLIVAKGEDGALHTILMAVPDSGDLRDISSALGGTATAYLQEGAGGRARLEESLSADSSGDRVLARLGLLKSFVGGPSTRGEQPTVVRIVGPGTVEGIFEGALAVDRVHAASTTRSQWEIGDWT